MSAMVFLWHVIKRCAQRSRRTDFPRTNCASSGPLRLLHLRQPWSLRQRRCATCSAPASVRFTRLLCLRCSVLVKLRSTSGSLRRTGQPHTSKSSPKTGHHGRRPKLLCWGQIRSPSRPSPETQLLAGDVDSRLLSALTSLAASLPIDIVNFQNVGPGAGADMPLRDADLAITDSAAHMSSSEYLQTLQAQLNTGPGAHPASMTTGFLPGGQDILRVEFPAPSPLLLLGPLREAGMNPSRTCHRCVPGRRPASAELRAEAAAVPAAPGSMKRPVLRPRAAAPGHRPAGARPGCAWRRRRERRGTP